MFQKRNKVKNIFKQNYKAKRVVLAGLFKELEKYVKKEKFGDVLLVKTVS